VNIHLVQDLVPVSKRAGYKFVQRTVDDWATGANKFDKPGERLFGIVSKDGLIGVGGLSHDPYTDDSQVGRVRHLYIHEAHRRKGYATMLMKAIMEEARLHYRGLRLFTDNPDASLFYEVLGFKQTTDYKVSHTINFDDNYQTD